MMKKKYLMKGFAALALVVGFASCVKDVEGMSPAEEEAKEKENAELQLGITIPDGQTWSMSTQVTANVTIDLNPSETYTVGICDKNPLNYEDAMFYALKTAEGGSMTATFTAPEGKEEYYVVTYNSKYQALVNRVEAQGGVINAHISYTGASSRAMRGTNRATAHGITFPDAPAATDYKTTYPDGTPYLGTYQTVGVFYADERNDGQNIQLNGGWDSSAGKNINGGPLYIVSSSGEKVTIRPSYFYYDARGEGGAILYICPNVTLKLNANDSQNLQKGLKIYIAAGAALECEGELKILANSAIYNKGTITAPKLTVAESGILYNQNVVNVEGKIKVANAESYIVNEGTLTADDFGSEGSGTFWNVNGGVVEIEGETLVNSNSNGWVNDGQYTTNTFVYNAGSIKVYNSCKLTTHELFKIQLGDSDTSTFFNEGSIVCEKDFMLLGPARINMASNSVIDVAGTSTMGCKKAFYGIYGPETGNYAVFKANNIVAHTANQEYTVSYGGNLAVVCNSHFAQSTTGRPYIGGGNTEGYDPGAGFCDVTIYKGGEMPDIPAIEPTTCNPGFEPGDGGGDFLDEPEVYSYAFEDQIYNGDYDMNDVVLKVSYHAVRDSRGRITAIETNKLDVKMVAAGATFNINAYIGTTDIFGKEIHAQFGVNAGVMVNTGNGSQTKPVQSTTINAPSNWNGNFDNLDVWIWVNKGSGLKSETKIKFFTEKEKKVPYAIMIPSNWRWPLERTCITEAYPGKPTGTGYNINYSFKKWAETPNNRRTNAMKSWFEYPSEGKTMTNE